MTYKKIVVNDEVLIDLTNDTVEPENLHMGKIAHKASGEVITGTAQTYEEGYAEAMDKTNSATATADNIHAGKTAWINGEEVTGIAKTYEEGYEEGVLTNNILYGLYILDRTKIIENKDQLIPFQFNAEDLEIYANFCVDDRPLDYANLTVKNFRYSYVSTNDNVLNIGSTHTSLDERSYVHQIDLGAKNRYMFLRYRFDIDTDEAVGDLLPDEYKLIIHFTKPTEVPTEMYTLFKLCENNSCIYSGDFTSQPQETEN